MNLLRVFALACGMAVLGTTGVAQEKAPPAKKPAKAKTDPNIRTGDAQRVLHHGDRVTLKNKGEATVVWQDAKNNRVYVRTKPGERPIAVTMNDIANVRPVVGTKNTGGVRPAVEGQLPTPQSVNEIQPVEIFNGPYRTLHFLGRDLSPAERAQLKDLERSANRVADDEELVENLQNAAQQQALGTSSTQEVVVRNPGVAPYGYSGYPGVYPYNYFAPYYPYYFYPISYYNDYYFNYYPPLAFFPPYMPQVSQPTVIVQNSTGSSGGGSQADVTKALQTAQERLRKDRETYTQASSRAVYDNNGRIIAVRFEEK
jgi:hypothetical protein